jgi:hypothetical protein
MAGVMRPGRLEMQSPGALPTYTSRFTEPLNNAAQDGYKPFATSAMATATLSAMAIDRCRQLVTRWRYSFFLRNRTRAELV